jgi:hypothetical protein
MPVHSLLIFDRKGRTLFTKRFVKDTEETDLEALSDQHKLVFGMLFSLRETAAILAPDSKNKDSGLHSVKTGASTLHSYETTSGLRFALYVTNDGSNSNSSNDNSSSIRTALQHVYNELWIQCVIRSPLYTPTKPNVEATNFEEKLSGFMQAQTWFR